MSYIGTMKLNTINSQIKNNKMHENHAYIHKQNNFSSVNFKEREKENNYKYNTNRPAQAISFGGSAVSMSEKFIKNGFMNKVVGFVYDNEAAYNAVFSLFVAGMLKPFVVLNMPGSEEKDKQIVATKNFIQAFLGSFLGMTITGGIIKKSVDIINNNLNLVEIDKATNKIKYIDFNNDKLTEIAKKLVKKDNTGIKARFSNSVNAFSSEQGIKKLIAPLKAFMKAPNYTPTADEIKARKISVANAFNRIHKDVFETNIEFTKKLISDGNKKEAYNSFWKNITGSPVAIGKAKIASVLLPSVVALLFANRKTKDSNKNENSKNSTQENKTDNRQQDSKTTFKQNPNKNNIAFKGSLKDTVINSIALNVEKLSMSKAGESCVNSLASLPKVLNKPSARMADIESVLVTLYWINNTLKSKKIEPSQKLGLNVHSATVTLVSSTCAFIIDTMLDGLIDKTSAKYGNIINEIVQEVPENLKQTKDKEKIANFLKEKASTLLNSEEIVKSFSNIDFNDKELVDKTVRGLSSTYKKQLSKFKSLTIFTFVVRFLVPVLMVPVSGKIKRKIVEARKEKEQKTENANKK